MSEVVSRLDDLLSRMHVAENVRPILTFLIMLAVVFAVFFGVLRIGVKAGWMSRDTAAFWAFVSPWLAGFLLFTAGPMVYSLVLSFMDWDLLDPAKFTGLANYHQAVHDAQLGQAIKVTLIYAVVSVPLQTILSLGVALLMNVNVRGINLFRTMWYLPSLVTGVAQTVLFIYVFNPDFGLLNGALRLVGIEGPKWLFDPHWALSAVIIMSLWTVGGNMVIYLAGLRDVPAELYEAAEVDGAGWWRTLWNITLPQVSPVIFFNVVTGLIVAMQTFTQGFLLRDQAGLGNSLLFYVLYLYQNAFSLFKIGYASTLAWILFVMIMLLTALMFRGSDFWVYYESQRPSRRRRRVRVS